MREHEGPLLLDAKACPASRRPAERPREAACPHPETRNNSAVRTGSLPEFRITACRRTNQASENGLTLRHRSAVFNCPGDRHRVNWWLRFGSFSAQARKNAV